MEARLAGETTIDGLQLTEDVIPDVVLRMAFGGIRKGLPPHWSEPRLLLFGDPPIAVGSLAFKGVPNKGRVEIGYGIAPPYTGKGLATAGVRLLVRYALSQADVEEVYAETAVSNTASRRVLQKAGFRHIGQRDSEDDGLVDGWLLHD
jgi:RimJ/RimL family protein N-acetyltransferase